MASKKKEGSDETLPVLAPYAEQGTSLVWDDEGGKVVGIHAPEDGGASLVSKKKGQAQEAKKLGMQATRAVAQPRQKTPEELMMEIVQTQQAMQAPAAVQPQVDPGVRMGTQGVGDVPAWLVDYMNKTGGK